LSCGGSGGAIVGRARRVGRLPVPAIVRLRSIVQPIMVPHRWAGARRPFVGEGNSISSEWQCTPVHSPLDRPPRSDCRLSAGCPDWFDRQYRIRRWRCRLRPAQCCFRPAQCCFRPAQCCFARRSVASARAVLLPPGAVFASARRSVVPALRSVTFSAPAILSHRRRWRRW